ncbi:MAG: 50S ribosomal protein L11 [Chloroflexi bacterium]|nr:MAG: 50S ribosomal protein L11 [Chloroflexota bacterium]
MAKKKVSRVLTLNIKAGEASPATVAKDLGPLGINIMQFCQAYNAATTPSRGLVVPAKITVFEDRSFQFAPKTPTTASLLRRAAGVDKGSAKPNRRAEMSISRDQLREIVDIKLPDMNTWKTDTAEKMVVGAARSMGIEVKD